MNTSFLPNTVPLVQAPPATSERDSNAFPIHELPFPHNYNFIYHILFDRFYGNITKTAKYLRISRCTVYSAKKWHDDPNNFDYQSPS